jgi:hypothetical protein
MSEFKEKRISSNGKSKKGRNDDAKISRHTRRYDDEEEEEEEENDYQENEEGTSESEGESENDSEDRFDDDDEDVDRKMYSKIEEKAKPQIEKQPTFEQQIDIGSLAIDQHSKDILKDGCVVDYLVFTMVGSLSHLKEPLIELRVDQDSSRLKSTSAEALSKSLSEIKSISITRYSNTFPVNIAATVNGVKDANVSSMKGSGISADLIFLADDKVKFTPEGRLLICPTKRTGGRFFEKNPDATIHSITTSYTDIPNTEFCFIKEGSHLLQFIQSEFPTEKLQNPKEGLFIASQDLKTRALETVKKQLDSKNVCNPANITLTVHRAAKGQKSSIAAWHDVDEIKESIGSHIPIEEAKRRQMDALSETGRLIVELKVVHKPIKN